MIDIDKDKLREIVNKSPYSVSEGNRFEYESALMNTFPHKYEGSDNIYLDFSHGKRVDELILFWTDELNEWRVVTRTYDGVVETYEGPFIFEELHAKKLLEAYHKESSLENLEGVVNMSPKVISKL